MVTPLQNVVDENKTIGLLKQLQGQYLFFKIVLSYSFRNQQDYYQKMLMAQDASNTSSTSLTI